MEWATQFYKQQFLISKLDFEELPNWFYLQEVARIKEQMGKPFYHVLELGAGIGRLANTLASQEKDVISVELVEDLVEYAKTISTAPVKILCGDFYEIELNKTFDCVLYIDGFGIGEDEDQLRLLKKIYGWLTDDGYALIDIYEPNYWRQVYKGEMRPDKDSSVLRMYDYDEQASRFTDTWWHMDNEAEKYTQSLKCYSPQRIYELCQQANLDIVGYFPSGAMNFETWTYYEPAAINHCISYRIKLKKK